MRNKVWLFPVVLICMGTCVVCVCAQDVLSALDMGTVLAMPIPAEKVCPFEAGFVRSADGVEMICVRTPEMKCCSGAV